MSARGLRREPAGAPSARDRTGRPPPDRPSCRRPRSRPGPSRHDLRLDLGRRVVDARPLELLEPRDVERPVRAPVAITTHWLCDLRAVVEPDHVVPVAPGERRRPQRESRPRAELVRLDRGALGELGSRDAGREAEVVLDPGRRARLSARCAQRRRRSCRDPPTPRTRPRRGRPGRGRR